MPDSSQQGLPRAFEAAVSLVGLAAAAPVLAAAGLAVKATSRGPALFKQRRVGRGGVPFTLYKMRTMTVDNAGPGVTAGNDNRITAVGRFLRKSKLDELPELWNVVTGDLSLVGPRPEVERYVDLDDPRWVRVLSERPGLTHPVTLRLRNEEALLEAAGGDTDAYYVDTLLPYKLQGYLDYIDRRSWRSDIAVIAKTALVILVPALAPPPTAAEIAHSGEYPLGAAAPKSGARAQNDEGAATPSGSEVSAPADRATVPVDRALPRVASAFGELPVARA